jgi:hypothetical protein
MQKKTPEVTFFLSRQLGQTCINPSFSGTAAAQSIIHQSINPSFSGEVAAQSIINPSTLRSGNALVD